MQLKAVLAENLLPFVTLAATFRGDDWAYTSWLRRLNQTAVPGTTLPTLGASLISERQNDAVRERLETNSNQSPHWSEDDVYADFPKVRFPKEFSSTSDFLKTAMAIASDLLQRHFQTLVEDNAQWQTLITDSIVWELPYAPAIGHPPQLSGRLEVVRHVTWFVNAVEDFRFFDMKVQAMNDPEAAVAEVKAEGLIKATGRIYHQDYVVFLRAFDGKIAFLREYFDPTRAAKALDTPILGLNI